jgi:hypothetical protein
MNDSDALAHTIADWRSILSAAPPEARLGMFETAADEVAEFIRRGFNGTEIGDGLNDLAVQVGTGLDDVDARQGIIAAAILKAANGHKPLLTSRAKFLADFVAPDYLVDGIIQRLSLYALTGLTGGGKAALALELTSAVARICDRATFGVATSKGGGSFISSARTLTIYAPVSSVRITIVTTTRARIEFISSSEFLRSRKFASAWLKSRNARRSSPGDY